MRKNSGFTLVELMIVVAIVAILARLAVPAYLEYMLRGKVAEGTSALAELKIRMEQWYASNRTYYLSPTDTSNPTPCASTLTTASGAFQVSCTIDSANSYTLTAQGVGAAAGFKYTVDQDGTRTSTISHSGWTATCATAWITKPGMACPS